MCSQDREIFCIDCRFEFSTHTQHICRRLCSLSVASVACISLCCSYCSYFLFSLQFCLTRTHLHMNFLTAMHCEWCLFGWILRCISFVQHTACVWLVFLLTCSFLCFAHGARSPQMHTYTALFLVFIHFFSSCSYCSFTSSDYQFPFEWTTMWALVWMCWCVWLLY